LTTEEIARAADEMAACVARAEALETRKREFMSETKVQTDAIDGTLRRLAKMIRTRSEDREIECRVIYDEIRFCVDTVRDDSGELIETRPMTESEIADAKQQKLPGMAAHGKKTRGRGKLVSLDGDKKPDDDPKPNGDPSAS